MRQQNFYAKRGYKFKKKQAQLGEGESNQKEI